MPLQCQQPDEQQQAGRDRGSDDQRQIVESIVYAVFERLSFLRAIETKLVDVPRHRVVMNVVRLDAGPSELLTYAARP